MFRLQNLAVLKAKMASWARGIATEVLVSSEEKTEISGETRGKSAQEPASPGRTGQTGSDPAISEVSGEKATDENAGYVKECHKGPFVLLVLCQGNVPSVHRKTVTPCLCDLCVVNLLIYIMNWQVKLDKQSKSLAKCDILFQLHSKTRVHKTTQFF